QKRNASARMDERKYPGISPCAAAIRIQLRLAARDFDVRAGVLPVEPVVFPAHAGERHRLSQEEQSELVPGMRHSARERTSDRRILLASRDDAGRTKGTRAVVPA